MELVKYDEMVRAIQICQETDEVKDIRDKAVALEAYAKQAKNREAERQCAEIRIRAERQWGQLYRDSEKPTGGGDRKSEEYRSLQDVNTDSDESKTLSEMGVTGRQSMEWQGLADLSEDEFEGAIATLHEEEQKPTVAKVQAHVANNSGNNEWYTPPAIIEAARSVMGAIDLDPASSEIANKAVGAPIFYSESDCGLEKDWVGRVWMNPPYAQPLIQQFCEKLVGSEFVTDAVVLVNNGTETKWGQVLLSACSAVCFPTGRIRFVDPEGNLGNAPLQGQMIVYLGEKKEEFCREFSGFGICLEGMQCEVMDITRCAGTAQPAGALM